MPRDAMAELSVDRVAALDPDGAVDGERRPDRPVDELVDLVDDAAASEEF